MQKLKSAIQEIGSNAHSILNLTSSPLSSTAVTVTVNPNPATPSPLNALPKDDDAAQLEMLQQKLSAFNQSDATFQLSRRISMLKNPPSSSINTLDSSNISVHALVMQLAEVAKSSNPHHHHLDKQKSVNKMVALILEHIQTVQDLELSFKSMLHDKQQIYSKLLAKHQTHLGIAAASELKYKEMLDKAHSVVAHSSEKYKDMLLLFEKHVGMFGTGLLDLRLEFDALDQLVTRSRLKVAAAHPAVLIAGVLATVEKRVLSAVDLVQELAFGLEQVSRNVDTVSAAYDKISAEFLLLQDECRRLTLDNENIQNRLSEVELERTRLLQQCHTLETDKNASDDVLKIYSLDIQQVKAECLALKEENRVLFDNNKLGKQLMLHKQSSSSSFENDTLDSLRERLDCLESEKTALETKLRIMERDYAELEESFKAEKLNLIEEIQQVATKEQVLQGQVSQLKTERDTFDVQILELNGEIQSLKATNKELTEQVGKSEDLLITLETEKLKLEERLFELEEDGSSKVADFNVKLATLTSEKLALSEELNRLKVGSGSSELELEKLCRCLEEKDRQLIDLTTHREELQSRLGTITDELSAIQIDKMTLEESLSTAQAVKVNLEESLSTAQAVNVATQSELQLLKKENLSLQSKLSLNAKQLARISSVALDKNQSMEDIQQVSKKLLLLNEQLVVVASEKSAIEEKLVFRDAEAAGLHEELADANLKIVTLNMDVEAWQARHEETVKELTFARKLNQDLSFEVESKVADCEIAQETIIAKDLELDLLNSKLAALTRENLNISELNEKLVSLQGELKQRDEKISALTELSLSDQSKLSAMQGEFEIARNSLKDSLKQQDLLRKQVDSKTAQLTAVEDQQSHFRRKLENFSRLFGAKLQAFHTSTDSGTAILSSLISKFETSLKGLSSEVNFEKSHSSTAEKQLKSLREESSSQLVFLSSSLDETSQKLSLKIAEFVELKKQFQLQNNLLCETQGTGELREAEIAQLKSQLMESKDALELLESKLNDAENKLESCKFVELELKSRISTLEHSSRLQESELSKLAEAKESYARRAEELGTMVRQRGETIDALEQQVDELTKERSEIGGKFEDFREQIVEFEDQCTILEDDLQVKCDLLEQKEQAIARLCDDLASARLDSEKARNQVNVISKQLDGLRAQVSSLSMSESEKDKLLEALRVDLESASSENESLILAIEEVAGALGLPSAKDPLSALREIKQLYESKQAEFAAAVAQSTTELAQVQTSLSNLQRELAAVTKTKEEAEKSRSNLSIAVEKYDRNLKEKTKEIAQVQAELASCKDLISDLPTRYEESISLLQARLQNVTSDLETVFADKESMAESLKEKTEKLIELDTQLSAKKEEIAQHLDALQLQRGECLLINMQNDELSKRLADLEHAKALLETVADESEAKYAQTLEAVQADLERMTADSERFEKMTHQMCDNIEELQETLASSREEVTALQRTCATLECDKRELVEELAQSRSKRSTLENTAGRLVDEVEALKTKLSRSAQVNEDGETMASIDAKLRADKKSMETRLEKLEVQLRKYEGSRQVYKKKIASLETELCSKKDVVDVLQAEITSLVKENREMSAFIEKHSSDAAFILKALSETATALRITEDNDDSALVRLDNQEPLKESDLAEHDMFEEANAEFRKSVDEIFKKSLKEKRIVSTPKQALEERKSFHDENGTNSANILKRYEEKIRKLYMLVEKGEQVIQTGSDMVKTRNHDGLYDRYARGASSDEKENALFHC